MGDHEDNELSAAESDFVNGLARNSEHPGLSAAQAAAFDAKLAARTENPRRRVWMWAIALPMVAAAAAVVFVMRDTAVPIDWLTPLEEAQAITNIAELDSNTGSYSTWNRWLDATDAEAELRVVLPDQYGTLALWLDEEF